ncbi:MAG: toll/interleukin-1 receptor domain-containing protein [Gammaproteobacteria bacterium]
MTPRVFISYRTSDGADKATALARELDALFGDAQVFLDKDDLPAGSRWHDVIRHTLGSRPVLLVLVTPQYLDALDTQGRRRIESPDDPVRNELAAALAADAHIIPVLCDGVAQTPDASALPPPLDQLAERTWRRLRAYDWKQDVARLAADLRALSIEAHTDAPATTVRPAGDAPPARRRRTVVFGLGGLALLAAAGSGWWWWQAPRNATRLSGTWTAMIAPRGAPTVRNAERLQFRIEHDGDRLRLTSVPVEIERDPAWAEYRKFWRERTGQALRHVVYRGVGTVRFDPGVPGSIDVAMRIETQTGEGPIDGGNLQAAVGEAGRRMTGRLWLNGEQAERVVELRRAR